MKQKTVGYVIMWVPTKDLIGYRTNDGLWAGKKTGLIFSNRPQTQRAIKEDVKLYNTDKEDYEIIRLVKDVD